MFNRRSFLKTSAVMALAPTVPMFLSKTAARAGDAKDSNILVVLQLDGGNDALNTLVPKRSEEYRKLRPRLAIAAKDTVSINDDYGLHPQMRPLETLLAAGEVATIQGIGYPNPSRSHFESMAVWHTAKRDPGDHTGYGWLGRAMDLRGGDSYLIGGEIPLALRGRRSAAVSLTRFEDLMLANPASVNVGGASQQEDLLAFVSRHSVEASTAAERLAGIAKAKVDATYPQNALGERMKLIGRLIKGDLGTRVFYTTQGGYDTHSGQQFNHANLLNDFASSVAAFFKDMKAAKLADRITLLAFSEFGRTIKENGSAGTDHGTAGVSFLFGPNVVGGLHGKPADWKTLKDGEPTPTCDFRQLYAGLLSDWLKVDGDVLDGKYEAMKLVKG
jgi:uncharacterized protein (DUF1501 family)